MDLEGAPSRLSRLPTWLLGQLNLAGRRALTEVFAAHQLQHSHYSLLAALEEFGPQSQSDLSERSGLDRSDLVRIVDELAVRRVVTREPHPADRRRNLVSINAAGRRLLVRLDGEVATAQDRVLSRLSPRERAQLVTLLRRALGVSGSDGAAPAVPDLRWH